MRTGSFNHLIFDLFLFKIILVVPDLIRLRRRARALRVDECAKRSLIFHVPKH